MTRYSLVRQAASTLKLLLLALVAILSGCDQPQERSAPVSPAVQEPRGTIVAMGDSLTAGLGVSPTQAYPAVLQDLLGEAGIRYRVVNSGVSGETSSGARARVDWVLKLQPDLVILETGANDGLRGLDPDLVEENIRAILKRLAAEEIPVLLVGMRMVTNLGSEYLEQFNGLYPALADEFNLVFMPFFLEGVAMQPHLNQADGIHPNAEGYRIIAGNVLPYVRRALPD